MLSVDLLNRWTTLSDEIKKPIEEQLNAMIPEWIAKEQERINNKVANWQPIDSLNRCDRVLTWRVCPTQDKDSYLCRTEENGARLQDMVLVNIANGQWTRVIQKRTRDFMPSVFDADEPMVAFETRSLFGFAVDLLFYRFTGLYCCKYLCRVSGNFYFKNRQSFVNAIEWCKTQQQYQTIDAQQLQRELKYQFDSSLEMGREECWTDGQWFEMLDQGVDWIYRPNFTLRPRYLFDSDEWTKVFVDDVIQSDQTFTCNECQEPEGTFVNMYHCLECVQPGHSFDVCAKCIGSTQHIHPLVEGHSQTALATYKSIIFQTESD